MSDKLRSRIPFIDALRGYALVLMVLNHSALYSLDQTLDPGRHYLVYLTVSLSAPLFLFLVGFSLSLSYYRNNKDVLVYRTSICWKHIKKGIGLILAGFVLNIIIAPHEPIYSGGILQTIGISIILITPGLFWLKEQRFRDGILILAFILYLLFVYTHSDVMSWVDQNPVFAHLFMEGFPPWPWICMVLVGLVFGYRWAVNLDHTDGVTPFISQMKTYGIICLVIYFGLNAWQGDIINFNINRDYIINGHWLPSSITIFWVIGMTLLSFVMLHRLYERPVKCGEWLVAIGQSAFLLYVIHLIIIVGVAKQMFGLIINQWWMFGLFNLLLIAALAYFSRGLLAFKKRNQNIKIEI